MTAGADQELSLAFETRGAPGLISVRVRPNTDPGAVGADPTAHGFPICEATVSTELSGYNALFGWIQVVGVKSRGTAGRHFDPDPLQIFDNLNTPFGFYGLNPTLFDAPSRRDRTRPLDWLAHAFLCVSPGSPMERAVQPVAAFQWGFRLGEERVHIGVPSELPLVAWARHRELLRVAYPGWRFEAAP